MAKPRANIYTVLLVVALVAVLIGVLFMILELRRYEFEKRPNARRVPAAATQFLVPGQT